MTIQEIESAALRLEPNERAVLVNQLSSSLEANGSLDQHAFDPHWVEIAERRLQEVLSNAVAVQDGAAVMQRMKTLARP